MMNKYVHFTSQNYTGYIWVVGDSLLLGEGMETAKWPPHLYYETTLPSKTHLWFKFFNFGALPNFLHYIGYITLLIYNVDAFQMCNILKFSQTSLVIIPLLAYLFTAMFCAIMDENLTRWNYW